MSDQLQHVIEKFETLPKEKRDQLMEEANKATAGLRWFPNPGPQTEAYFCDADELFYGGQAGPGKTDLGLGLAVNEHRRTLFLREFNDDARDAAERFLEIMGSRKGWNGQLLSYSGEEMRVEFGGCKAEEDKQRYKGKPNDLIVFDEVGDFSKTQYEFICAWNRSTDPKQRCRVLATGNPPTRAKGMWVIQRWAAWLDPKHPHPAMPGEIRWYTTDEDGREIEVNGRGPHKIGNEEILAKSRTFIRGTLADNPDLAATSYDATLAALPKQLRQAYRDGMFDAALRDAPMQVIPTAWVRAAIARWTEHPPKGVPMCAMGVDCSGGGENPMMIAQRYDGWFAKLIEVPGSQIPADSPGKYAAGFVIGHRRDRAIVVVDMGGGYGGPLYEHLNDNDITVEGHKGAESSTRRTKDGQLKFYNKRSEAIWRFREALDPDQSGGSAIALPDDTELVADLTVLTFEVVSGGIKVISKEKVVSTLGRSTDKGDAIIMANSVGPTYVSSAGEWQSSAEMGGRLNRRPVVISGRQNSPTRHNAKRIN